METVGYVGTVCIHNKILSNQFSAVYITSGYLPYFLEKRLPSNTNRGLDKNKTVNREQPHFEDKFPRMTSDELVTELIPY